MGDGRTIIVRVTDERTRVVVADDDVLLREGLTSLLDRSGFDVTGQAGDARQPCFGHQESGVRPW